MVTRRKEFRTDGVSDGMSHLFKLLALHVEFHFADEHNIVFADADDIILILIREHILQDIVRNHFALIGKADEIDGFGRVHVKMKLFRLYVNITGQDIVQNDIFDKADFIVFFAVQAFDIEERHRKHMAQIGRFCILTLHGNDVFRTGIRAERTIGIAFRSNDGGVFVKASENLGSGFADMNKVGAGNDNAGHRQGRKSPFRRSLSVD